MWRNRERKDGEHEDAAPSPENPQQGGAQ